MTLDHCFRTLAAALWMTATAAPAVGQVDTTTPPDTVQASPQGAAVVVRGDTLFLLHGTLGPFTPAARASALVGRIDSLARTPGARSVAVEVVDTMGQSELRVGPSVLLRVLPEDTVGPARPPGEGGIGRAHR